MKNRTSRYLGLTALAILCVIPCGWANGQEAKERVLHNGKIFTAEPEHPYAEAVAIRGDKIVAVGTRAQAEQAVGKNAESTDLQGKTLLPGLIDSHIHAIDGGLSLTGADVGDRVSTIDELVAFVAEAKKSKKGMRGDILNVTGLPLAIWSKTADLNAKFSAGMYADEPLLLRGMDGHTGWANRNLLKRAGVTKEFISKLSEGERAYYGVGSDMQPNGFAVDAGLDKVTSVVPEATKEQWLEGGRAAVQYLHSLGITAWLDPMVNATILSTYRSLAERGELTVSMVAAFPVVNPRNDPVQEIAAVQKLRKEFEGVPHLTIPGFKIFADGVVEFPSQTAALTKPYKNTGRSGDLLFDPARFYELVTAADKQGLIVHVHALGDRAVKETLNAIEAARKANGNSGLPHTLTHVQLADPEDFPRFGQLGAIAALQLFWAEGDKDTIELMKPYVDPSLYQWQYPARSLLDAGATISGASDWSVSSPNVFWAMHRAETRKGPEGVLDANQRMPRDAMLYAYTRNSAIAMKQLDKIGSIAPGKQADLVLLDRDVMTIPAEELLDTKVLWTMVGGKTVWSAADKKDPF
ncbi:MAG TPA: amidohydrolase [Candidatus Acidoferrum sp.]|nr:amidohydrolase [Candidatus Acidoferrum sp.]